MIVCVCYNINEEEILEGNIEFAGTGCGCCCEEIEMILTNNNKEDLLQIFKENLCCDKRDGG